MIVGVPSADVGRLEPVLRPYLSQFEAWDYTADELLASVKVAERQCWCIVGPDLRGVALTRLQDDRCEITHLSGDGIEDWSEAITEIEAWARWRGCTELRATGRPGFERIGRKFGFRKYQVTLRKVL